jgi:hypothetical protein
MHFRPLLAATLLASARVPTLHAADPPAAAAAVIAKNQAALVEIKATLSIKPELIDGPPGIADMLNQQPAEDQPAEAKGVVIHATGLVVAPLAALDPGAMVGDGMELDTPLGKLKLGLKATVSAIKVITADGHEYPAEIILREAAAGLALLKLGTPPEGGLPAVTLTRDLPAPPPFSPILDLVRLDADFGRAPAVRLLRIVQTTPPPVPLYDVTGPLQTPGSAAFDLDGRFLGLSVIPLRDQAGAASLASVTATGLCILPVSEILRLSAKALP